MASVRSRSLTSLGQQRAQHPPGLLLKCTSRIIAISEATKSDGSGGCMTANAKIIRQESISDVCASIHVLALAMGLARPKKSSDCGD